MLRYEVGHTDGMRDGANVLVLLHGRGADRYDLLGLHTRFPDWVMVAPEAPFPAAPWGYGPGWAWYRFLGHDRPDEATFSESLDRLDEFLKGLPALLGITPGALALGGFSQGGTLSMGYALDNPGAVTRIVNLSGFLASHPRVRATAENALTTRFFWGHGRQDPNIPFELALEGRARLRTAEADLTTHDYQIGHWIDAQELEDVRAWLLT
ncbi:MAG: alpha/beta hydrolase [Longimicrobiales bacterium]